MQRFILFGFLLALSHVPLCAQSPVITSVSPTAAYVNDTITISGNNFGATPSSNTVLFGTIRATVVTASVSELKVVVPAHAAYDVVAVVVNGVRAESPRIFAPIFAGSSTISSGGFSTRVDFATSANASGIQVADIDADGKPEIIVLHGGSSVISVYRNTTMPGVFNASSLASPVDFSGGTNASDFVVADLNGDARPDLLTANPGSTFSALINNAVNGAINTGSFQSKIDFSFTTDQALSIASSDLDSDGKPDVVIATSSNEIVVFKNTSTSSVVSFDLPVRFSASSQGASLVALTDVDGDGKKDILSTNTAGTSFGVLRNITAGGVIDNSSFENIVEFSGAGAADIATMDLDADGLVDVVAVNGDRVTVNRNASSPGIVDASSFQSPFSYLLFNDASTVNVVDINGDQLGELITSNSSALAVYQNKAVAGTLDPSSFSAPVFVNAETGVKKVAVQDMDGDGRADLISLNPSQQTISLFRNLSGVTPAISSLSPSTVAPNVSLTINGSGFSSTLSNNRVWINNTRAILTAATNSTLTITVPSNATSGALRVQSKGITIQGPAVTITGTPSLSGFTPSSGAVGALVTINGNNFSTSPNENLVKFNGVTATVQTSTTSTMTVAVPAGATTGPISHTYAGVTSLSADNFTVVPAPVISSFLPARGAVGATVVINGSNFSSVASENVVRFNGVQANITSALSTQLTVVVPTGATTGVISVTAAGVTVNSTSNFTVMATPVITGLSPAAAAVAAEVVINGNNFGTNPSDHTVLFNGTVANIVSVASNAIRVVVPVGATTGNVTVQYAGVVATSPASFTVLPTPQITAITPGSASVGATVVIEGQHFSTVEAENIVRFNGALATVISSTTTSIQVNLPASATTGTVTLRYAGVTVSSPTPFTVLGTPVLSGVSPASAAVGAQVTITGINFNPSATTYTVRFNGVQASVTSINETTIVATVPNGATTGKISVNINGVQVQSTSDFVVLPTPALNSFSPGVGTIGTLVTLSGTNFRTATSENEVFFDGVPAVVATASATTLTTQVPAGAATGPITLRISGVTLTSSSPFVIDATSPVIVDQTSPEITFASNAQVSATIEDPETGIREAGVRFRSLSSGAGVTSVPLVLNAGLWQTTITASLIGALGFEYQIYAINQAGFERAEPFRSVYVRYGNEGLTIPYASFGKTISSYEIFSVPLHLDNDSVKAVFDELPSSDRELWRIFTYDETSGSTRELKARDTLAAGRGYWLIVRDNPGRPILSGSGRTVEQSFSVALKPGWNQIGNPYPFDLSWEDIAEANAGLPVNYKTYNGAIQGFENASTLEYMRGGFVFVDQPRTLTFPSRNNTGGRGASPFSGEGEWQLPMTVTQGELESRVAGLGMNEQASEGFDVFDGVVLPRWNSFVELSHAKSVIGHSLAHDIVPVQDKYQWNFDVRASGAGEVSLSWAEVHDLPEGASLVLVDKRRGIWLDMLQRNSYTFSPPAGFEIHFNRSGEVFIPEGPSPALADVYPNPSSGEFTVDVFMPTAESAELKLLNASGAPVKTLYQGIIDQGLQRVKCHAPASPGMYIVQLKSASRTTHQKLIIH